MEPAHPARQPGDQARHAAEISPSQRLRPPHHRRERPRLGVTKPEWYQPIALASTGPRASSPTGSHYCPSGYTANGLTAGPQTTARLGIRNTGEQQFLTEAPL